MAFDYGSIDLGLRNPFKKEGLVTAVGGAITVVLGIYLLVSAASIVKTETVAGWIAVVFGMLVLGGGIRATAKGITAMLRYFVGRNHPTSLSFNHSRSESSVANEESKYVAYNRQSLTEMLMGRKNSTFVEPQGFLARFVHTLFPRLTYMPYPVRNLAQRIFGAWVETLTALIAYALVAFVSLAGFVGEMGAFAFPIYSVILMLYLMLVWRRAGAALSRTADRSIPSMGSANLVKVVSGALLIPVLIGFGLAWLLSNSGLSEEKLSAVLSYLPDMHAWAYLLADLVLAAAASFLVVMLLRRRLQHADPKVEVSELRENWQESVHPNEVFINLDNLVMANRRYKEVPNRVYQELEPRLEEQTEGKGSFFGEMIQEIQPKFKAMNLGAAFDRVRLITLISGHVLFVITVFLTVMLAFEVIDTYRFVQQLGGIDRVSVAQGHEAVAALKAHMGSVVHLFLLGFMLKAFARLLANAAHLFFAEMQFESKLIYFKCEGTFTESRISTGTGIYDSTRSENTLVRSSITPWVIVTRIVSSTFAASGMRNLEHPRFILEMHKAEEELASIRTDVIRFLKDRESIASITSERDLTNASQIHEVNQATRAVPTQSNTQLTKDAEAAGYLRAEQSVQDKDETAPAE